MGEAGSEGASAEAAKAQCGTRRAPCAAVSFRHSVTPADPRARWGGLPPAPPPDSLPRGGWGAQRRRNERDVERERGCHAPAPEIRLPARFSALPRGCSSPRRTRNQADHPSRRRPPRACSPHDVRPSGQWRGATVRAGVPGRTMAERGDICPQLRPGAAIVPPPVPAPGGSGLHARSTPPRGPGSEVAGWISGDCPGARARRGRARTAAACGDLAQGGTPPRRPRPGARARARGGVPGMLNSAPCSRRAGAPPAPASPSRDPSEGGRERPGPALGRCGNYRPALCQRPRPWRRRDIHLAWQLLPGGGGGGRAQPPPYRGAAAGEARSRGRRGDPPPPSRCSLLPPRGAGPRRSRRLGAN